MTETGTAFFTPERFMQEQTPWAETPRGRLLIASCASGSYLSQQVVRRYQSALAEHGSDTEIQYLDGLDFHFSDGETCVRLDTHVAGCDVFLFQALYDPVSERTVDQNYMALLIAARALREHGAEHVTAVLPYLAYARQDKPTRFEREATTAKLMADLSGEAGIDRVVTWHPHSRHLRGFYGEITVDLLESLAFFVEAYRRFQGRQDVIAVAPDAGASKLVTYFARALDLNSAIASKHRPRPESAVITEIIGSFAGKRVALVLDDMISSGGTVHGLVKKLVQEKGIKEVYIGASHNLCMPEAYDRLIELRLEYNMQELMTTNSIPQTDAFSALPFLSVQDLSDVLARVLNRIHYNRSVSELFRKAILFDNRESR
jgi:ribose-phosphate pyrophosphokinase